MFFVAIVLLAALSITSIAGYFAILGLMAIFPGSVYAVGAMGAVLEFAKLTTASWIYRNWKVANKLLKTYFTVAVIVLSFITSMGVFGYLSKAHLEHSVTTGDNSIQIERIDARIAEQQRRIDDANRVVSQLDESVDTLIRYERIRGADGAIAVRQSQEQERSNLTEIITRATTQMDQLLDEKQSLETAQLSIEAEVGPIKYVAELFYGSGDKSTIDQAVRMMIIVLISVLDPLAILLVIAANMSLLQLKKDLTPEEEPVTMETVPQKATTVPMPKLREEVPKKREVVVESEADVLSMEKHDPTGSTHGVPAPDPPRPPKLKDKLIIDKSNVRSMKDD